MSETLGKKAESKIREWLNRPEEGYCFYRIPDQLGGYSGPQGSNPCDFLLYKYPYLYWIESKATEHDRFDFSMITDFQRESLLKYSAIDGVKGLVIVLFATYQRAFVFDIIDIQELSSKGTKSLNIKKIDKWDIEYQEIPTVPSRKQILDYDKNSKIF